MTAGGPGFGGSSAVSGLIDNIGGFYFAGVDAPREVKVSIVRLRIKPEQNTVLKCLFDRIENHRLDRNFSVFDNKRI